MRIRLIRLPLVFGGGALALSLPVLFGKSLSAHGDLYTYVFIIINMVPVQFLEWYTGRDLPQRPLSLVPLSVVFWAVVGLLVAVVLGRGSQGERARAAERRRR